MLVDREKLRAYIANELKLHAKAKIAGFRKYIIYGDLKRTNVEPVHAGELVLVAIK